MVDIMDGFAACAAAAALGREGNADGLAGAPVDVRGAVGVDGTDDSVRAPLLPELPPLPGFASTISNESPRATTAANAVIRVRFNVRDIVSPKNVIL